MVILAHIRDQHRPSLGGYGRPRMTEERNELGLRVGQRRVGRLMRRVEPPAAGFRGERPDQEVGRRHHLRLDPRGLIYLAVIFDLFSRRVICWAISNRMKQDLAIKALNMAIALRRPPSGCIRHTDRGPQYCAHEYQKILRRHRFTVLMSGEGNCHDNLAVESFFKSLKVELVWRRDWHTRREIEMPSSNTSTAFTTHDANTPPWAGNHPRPSNKGHNNMNTDQNGTGTGPIDADHASHARLPRR